MRKLHIALSTHKITESIKDYTLRLEIEPCLCIPDEYALWRTDTLNVSIRRDTTCESGTLRHFGWEDSAVSEASEDKDINGIIWERFSAQQQAAEINALWPEAKYQPK